MPLNKEVINSDKAPKPIGPYSHAVKVGNMLYTCGMVGSHPETRALVAGGVASETRQALTNLRNVVEEAGSSLDRVVKCTVFLVDLKEFTDMNSVYSEFFPSNPPARSCVQVSLLPMGARVEIEAIAVTKDGAAP